MPERPSAWFYVTIGTLSLFPYRMTVRVDYEITLSKGDGNGKYNDLSGKRYQLKRRILFGLLVLPVAWLNLFQPTPHEVLERCLADFLVRNHHHFAAAAPP